jgi:hypothetical protein
MKTNYFTILILSTLLISCSVVKNKEDTSSPAIEVELKVNQPVKLVEYIYGKSNNGPVGLDGSFTVIIKNLSNAPAHLQQWHVHSLLFEEVKSKKYHIIKHPCDCIFVARGFSDLPSHSIRLGPGKSKNLTIEEFGCNSIWHPPPPGEYNVYFRVRPFPNQLPPDDHGSIRDKLNKCVKTLLSDEFWKGGFISRPIRIRLIKPVKKHIRI